MLDRAQLARDVVIGAFDIMDEWAASSGVLLLAQARLIREGSLEQHIKMLDDLQLHLHTETTSGFRSVYAGAMRDMQAFSKQLQLQRRALCDERSKALNLEKGIVLLPALASRSPSPQMGIAGEIERMPYFGCRPAAPVHLNNNNSVATRSQTHKVPCAKSNTNGFASHMLALMRSSSSEQALNAHV